MNETLVPKIQDIFLAYAFALVYGNKPIKIFYGENKKVVLEFVEDAIRKNFLPIRYYNSLNEDEYRKHYEIDYYKDCVKTSIPKGSSKIKEELKKYIENYSQNNVASYTENLCRWEILEEQFDKSIDKRWVLSNVNINSFEHLPVIIKAVIDNRIKVDDILFYVDSDNLINATDALYIWNEYEDELQLNNNTFNKFEFSCTIDMTEYYKDMRKICTSGKTLTLEQKMLNEIDKLVHQKGKKAFITVKELISLYNNLVIKRKQLKSHDSNKRIQNYVSAYRKHKATDLTLGRVLDDEYMIVSNISSQNSQ